MNTHPTDRLSDYVDGGLDADARATIDAHLVDCAHCRAVVADLTALGGAAGAWRDAAVSPTVDLWPGIAARLNGRRDTAPLDVDPSPSPRAAWHSRRWSVGLGELAIAATLFAAVGALLWSRVAPAPSAGTPAPIIAEADAFDAGEAPATPVNFADAAYDAAVVDLERVLRDQRERLDPRTVVVLERNLRIIDDAIVEARQALASDPANALLNAHLAGARRRKLDLLRRAARITEGD